MKLFYEWGSKQLIKKGEELCGDTVAISRHEKFVTVALSDGLGSGVKANILSTLTSRIATRMLEEGLPLGEVVATLTATLPVCEIRKLAYSTFAIAQFFSHGSARIVQYDTPNAVLVRGRVLVPIEFESRTVDGKTLQEAVVDLELGDWLVFMSDGVINAGIGGLYPLGWGWDNAAAFIESRVHPKLSARDVAERVGEAVGELYDGRPGDDVSIVAVKVRHKRVAALLSGPPEERSKDGETIDVFLRAGGNLAVCGGTTAKIAARCMGAPLEVDLTSITDEVPPMGRIEGIDLVTEGILTLTQVGNLLVDGAGLETVRFRNDGASSLLRFLLESDEVRFMVGMAMNPAHQNPDFPHTLSMRSNVVRRIAGELKKRGIETSVTWI